MSKPYQTDWAAFDAISEDEAYANALADPDNPPTVSGRPVRLRTEDGATVLERFRKAVAREEQNMRGVATSSRQNRDKAVLTA